MRLSLLIPVYGSEAILEEGHRAYTAAATAVVGSDYEILYLVDGSPDNSAALLGRIAQRDPRVRVSARRPARGLGATLRELIAQASGERLVYLDADAFRCFDLSALPIAVALGDRADAVVMSRYNCEAKLPVHRRLASYAHWLLCRLAFGTRVRDLGSGFVLLRREALQGLELCAKGFEIHAELFAELRWAGRRVIEQPASYRHWEGGSFSVWRHGPGLLRGIAHLWWAKRRRRRGKDRASGQMEC